MEATHKDTKRSRGMRVHAEGYGRGVMVAMDGRQMSGILVYCPWPHMSCAKLLDIAQGLQQVVEVEDWRRKEDMT